MRYPIQHLNPEGLVKNPFFSQVVAVAGSHRTLYVGGQDAVDEKGNLVGKGDLAAQADQVFRNLDRALRGAGGALEHVVKWNVYVKQGLDTRPALEVFQRWWDGRGSPPAITVLQVAELAQPDYLLEIDAIAVVPEL